MTFEGLMLTLYTYTSKYGNIQTGLAGPETNPLRQWQAIYYKSVALAGKDKKKRGQDK